MGAARVLRVSPLLRAGRAGLRGAGPHLFLLAPDPHLAPASPCSPALQPPKGRDLFQPIPDAPSRQLSPLVEGFCVFHCPSPISSLMKFRFLCRSVLYRHSYLWARVGWEEPQGLSAARWRTHVPGLGKARCAGSHGAGLTLEGPSCLLARDVRGRCLPGGRRLVGCSEAPHLGWSLWFTK